MGKQGPGKSDKVDASETRKRTGKRGERAALAGWGERRFPFEVSGRGAQLDKVSLRASGKETNPARMVG